MPNERSAQYILARNGVPRVAGGPRMTLAPVGGRAFIPNFGARGPVTMPTPRPTYRIGYASRGNKVNLGVRGFRSGFAGLGDVPADVVDVLTAMNLRIGSDYAFTENDTKVAFSDAGKIKIGAVLGQFATNQNTLAAIANNLNVWANETKDAGLAAILRKDATNISQEMQTSFASYSALQKAFAQLLPSGGLSEILPDWVSRLPAEFIIPVEVLRGLWAGTVAGYGAIVQALKEGSLRELQAQEAELVAYKDKQKAAGLWATPDEIDFQSKMLGIRAQTREIKAPGTAALKGWGFLDYALLVGGIAAGTSLLKAFMGPLREMGIFSAVRTVGSGAYEMFERSSRSSAPSAPSPSWRQTWGGGKSEYAPELGHEYDLFPTRPSAAPASSAPSRPRRTWSSLRKKKLGHEYDIFQTKAVSTPAPAPTLLPVKKATKKKTG